MVDAEAVIRAALNNAVNPPKPVSLITSVPDKVNDLPTLKVAHSESGWLVSICDEYGAAQKQFSESVLGDKLRLEQEIRFLWSDLLQNRNHAMTQKLCNKSGDEPDKKDLEVAAAVAKDILATSAVVVTEVTVKYRGVEINLKV